MSTAKNKPLVNTKNAAQSHTSRANSLLFNRAMVSLHKILFDREDAPWQVFQCALHTSPEHQVLPGWAHHCSSCGHHNRLPRAGAKRPGYLFQLEFMELKMWSFAMLYFTCLLMAARREVSLLLLPTRSSSKSAAATFSSQSSDSTPTKFLLSILCLFWSVVMLLTL